MSNQSTTAAPLADSSDTQSPLKIAEFRYLLYAVLFSTLANRSLVVVNGYQIYQYTKNPFALGLLGLVEAIPAVSIALFGGYLADRADRRQILLWTQFIAIVCALVFATLSLELTYSKLVVIYLLVFISGVARSFSNPAFVAFEAQVVPRQSYLVAASWVSSTWQACAILGPALAGIVYDLWGASVTYSLIAISAVAAWCSTRRIAPKPKPIPQPGESIFQSIGMGVRYVIRTPELVGSMALDLFAVLFGGAMAMLPVFAADILKVGASGLGVMNAAPSIGALAIMLWSTRYPPIKNAGRNLMLCIAGFGLSIIVFALSTNFYLSLFALTLSGLFDGVSVVIRRSIIRLMSPENMRGRVAAVSLMFISSSNELGAFESGIAASLLGTVTSVWVGGVVTLLVVAATAYFVPRLRRLDLTV